MDRIGANSQCEVHDLLAVQEAFHWPGANHIGLISLFDVDPGRVGFGVDSDSGNIQFAAGSNNAHGDFAAISYQNFFEHTGPALLQSFEIRREIWGKNERVS